MVLEVANFVLEVVEVLGHDQRAEPVGVEAEVEAGALAPEQVMVAEARSRVGSYLGDETLLDSSSRAEEFVHLLTLHYPLELLLKLQLSQGVAHGYASWLAIAQPDQGSPLRF